MSEKFVERRFGGDRRDQENKQVEEIISFFIPEKDERRQIKDRRQDAQ